jgi:hypothetical protein
MVIIATKVTAANQASPSAACLLSFSKNANTCVISTMLQCR